MLTISCCDSTPNWMCLLEGDEARRMEVRKREELAQRPILSVYLHLLWSILSAIAVSYTHLTLFLMQSFLSLNDCSVAFRGESRTSFSFLTGSNSNPNPIICVGILTPIPSSSWFYSTQLYFWFHSSIEGVDDSNDCYRGLVSSLLFQLSLYSLIASSHSSIHSCPNSISKS